MTHEEFRRFIRQKGEELYRTMPWRDDTRPYYVLVSELMLQQTQVARVVPKFAAFVAAFPDERALARASLADVLKLWQGLGYNRRAKYLHDAATMIVEEFGGSFPSEAAELMRLPGVGTNTAGALQAYAFNQPSVFVETNIRTVYIHHFFHDRFDVDDREIRALLAQTLDRDRPREFYWALMDYGSWLKAQGVRNTSSSKHYKKQSPLRGSVREVRGQIVRVLARGEASEAGLRAQLGDDQRFTPALKGLLRDGLVRRVGQQLELTNTAR